MVIYCYRWLYTVIGGQSFGLSHLWLDIGVTSVFYNQLCMVIWL